ncbi:hypothetical protein KSP39_PZI007506 [Platanthera zijinensis]|uniref:Uncharacterized protein n=1 Tax=Platanthera zijinensis TaxID=2320716 RepID=A0AAP0BQW9_9ASPA
MDGVSLLAYPFLRWGVRLLVRLARLASVVLAGANGHWPNASRSDTAHLASAGMSRSLPASWTDASNLPLDPKGISFLAFGSLATLLGGSELDLGCLGKSGSPLYRGELVTRSPRQERARAILSEAVIAAISSAIPSQHIRREKLRVNDPSNFTPQLDFSDAETSSSSFLNPFEPAPVVVAACGDTIWNASLLHSSYMHLPSFPFSSYPLHEDISPLITPQPPLNGGNKSMLLLPNYVTNPLSVWTARSRGGKSQGSLALSLTLNPLSGQFASYGDRCLPIQ